MELIKTKTEFADKFKQISYDYSNLRARHSAATAMVLLATLGLSACGGGSAPATGSSNTGGNTSNGGTQTDQTNTGSDTSDDASVDDIIAGLDFGGGGGGGGGGFVSVPTPPAAASNELILYKSGSNYATTSVSGFSLVGSGAYYSVANSTSNAYSIDLDASGAGILTFDFVDANDVVTLESGSKITGFTQFKVVDGTVDVTDADMGGVSYISVASGIKLTAAQLLNVDDIVIRAGTGRIDVEVSSQAEIDQITTALANGSLELFSPGDLLNLTAASGGSVTADQITAGTTNVNAQKQPTASAPQEMSGLQTLLASNAYVSLTIDNNDRYINSTESAQPLKFYVSDMTGYTVSSVTVGGVTLSGTNGTYTLDAGSLSDGAHQVVVTLNLTNSGAVSGLSQNSVTLTSEIVLDRTAPAQAQVSISGADNGLNAAEVATLREVYITPESGAEVSSAKVNGVALGKSNGVFYLDARQFTDGSYDLDVTLVDSAGNTTSYSENFVVNLGSLQEAEISVRGGDFFVNSTEAGSNVTIDVDLVGAPSLVSARFNGSAITLDSSNSYTFNPASLSDGTYTFEIVSADAGGNQITSTQQLIIDTIAPASALIGIPNSASGLTLAERASSLDITVNPRAGADVISVHLDGSQLSEVADNIFRLDNASSISAGFHRFSVISEDAAGNRTNTTEDVMFVGGSTRLSDMFEFTTSSSSGTVTVEAYIKNFAPGLGDGIKSLSFWLNLNDGQANYTEGTYRMLAEGGFYIAPTENGPKGEVLSSVAFGSAWNSFDEPFFSFSAYAPNVSRLDVELVDFTLYTSGLAETNFGTILTSIDV